MAVFLDRGAPIDARNLDGSTALFKAAETGRLDIVKLLVERGANVDLPGRSGVAPLSAASFMGSAPIVEFLIAKGADPNWIDGTQKAAQLFGKWFMAGGGSFRIVGRSLVAQPGSGGIGLLYYTGEQFDDWNLERRMRAAEVEEERLEELLKPRETQTPAWAGLSDEGKRVYADMLRRQARGQS